MKHSNVGPKTWHILLADDDSSDRFFFEKALKEISIKTELKTAEDGEKLLSGLKNNSDLPDVIFLDLNMPRKNGHECLLEIKQDPKLKDIPVIIYSTSLHKEVAVILYRNGAAYYLKKCSLDELPAYIEKALFLLNDNSSQPSKEKFVLNDFSLKF